MEQPIEKVKRTDYTIDRRRLGFSLIFLIGSFGALATVPLIGNGVTNPIDAFKITSIIPCAILTAVYALGEISASIIVDTHTIKNGQPLLTEEDVQSIK